VLVDNSSVEFAMSRLTEPASVGFRDVGSPSLRIC
jgi:hypothetical protein